jgi:hypothetical protein
VNANCVTMCRLVLGLTLLAASMMTASVAIAAEAACPAGQSCPQVRLDPDHGPQGTRVVIVDLDDAIAALGWESNPPCIWLLRPGEELGHLSPDELSEESDAAFVDGHVVFFVPKGTASVPVDLKPGRYVPWALTPDSSGYCYPNGPDVAGGVAVLPEFTITRLPDTATADSANTGQSSVWIAYLLSGSFVAGIALSLRHGSARRVRG